MLPRQLPAGFGREGPVQSPSIHHCPSSPFSIHDLSDPLDRRLSGVLVRCGATGCSSLSVDGASVI